MGSLATRTRRLDGPFVDTVCVELDEARRRLEDLAVSLCLDDAIVLRHAASLQGFDAITQCLGEIVALLRHQGGADEAIAAIRLDAMRERLRHLAG